MVSMFTRGSKMIDLLRELLLLLNQHKRERGFSTDWVHESVISSVEGVL